MLETLCIKREETDRGRRYSRDRRDITLLSRMKWQEKGHHRREKMLKVNLVSMKVLLISSSDIQMRKAIDSAKRCLCMT
jgi:hypothetical protein